MYIALKVESACACVAVYRHNTPLPAGTYIYELSGVGALSTYIDTPRLAQILTASNIFCTARTVDNHKTYTIETIVFERIKQSPGLEEVMRSLIIGPNKKPISLIHAMLANAIESLGPKYALYQPQKALKSQPRK
ncbi:MAG: hypothetical protein HYT16_01760 [DPANN group archaeon]|nr:hypothetical protein [DPANN group archaeon]